MLLVVPTATQNAVDGHDTPLIAPGRDGYSWFTDHPDVDAPAGDVAAGPATTTTTATSATRLTRRVRKRDAWSRPS